MSAEANVDGSDVELREAKVEDCEDLIKLIQIKFDYIMELASFDKMPNVLKIDAATLRKDGFGLEKMFRCLVAESLSEKRIVGYALYFFKYSTWEGVSMYMEDLYVTPAFRLRGIGTRMWRRVAKVAIDRKCRRMDWVCLGWNQRAIQLYKWKGSRNMTADEEWNLIRLDGQKLIDFANGV